MQRGAAPGTWKSPGKVQASGGPLRRFGVCWGGSIKSKIIQAVRVALACLASVTSVEEHLGSGLRFRETRGQRVLPRD